MPHQARAHGHKGRERADNRCRADLGERLTPMTALLTLAGRYEQRAIMWKAHAEHHALKRRGDG